MKLKIEIATDNDAFGEGLFETGAEAAAILRKLAGKLEREGLGEWSEGNLFDVNGNKVGAWSHND